MLIDHNFSFFVFFSTMDRIEYLFIRDALKLIIHYNNMQALTNNIEKNTLESLDPMMQHNMGQRVGLSHLNAQFINYAYCNG